MAFNGTLLALDGTDYGEIKVENLSLELMPGDRSVLRGGITIRPAEENDTFCLHLNKSQERVTLISGKDKAVVHVTITDDEEDENGNGASEWCFEAIILTTFSQTRCSLLIK